MGYKQGIDYVYDNEFVRGYSREWKLYYKVIYSGSKLSLIVVLNRYRYAAADNLGLLAAILEPLLISIIISGSRIAAENHC
jgi:hypothetical protein